MPFGTADRTQDTTPHTACIPEISLTYRDMSNSLAFTASKGAQAFNTDVNTAASDMAGTWTKDEAASDCLDCVLDVMRISGLMRRAMVLINGIRLGFTDTHFTYAITSIIPGFKVVEGYPLSGQAVQVKRRDFRAGLATGSVRGSACGGAVELRYTWPEPIAGEGCDTFCLVEPGRLHVRTVMVVGDNKRVAFTTAYMRK